MSPPDRAALSRRDRSRVRMPAPRCAARASAPRPGRSSQSPGDRGAPASTRSFALTDPARVTHDVLDWRDRIIVAVRGVHAPPHVGLRGEGEEWKPAIPATRAKTPGHANEIHRKRGLAERAGDEAKGETGP